MFILSVAVTLEYHKEKSCWEFKIRLLNRTKKKKKKPNPPQKCKSNVKYLQAKRQNSNLPNQKEHCPPRNLLLRSIISYSSHEVLTISQCMYECKYVQRMQGQSSSPSDATACQGKDEMWVPLPLPAPGRLELDGNKNSQHGLHKAAPRSCSFPLLPRTKCSWWNTTEMGGSFNQSMGKKSWAVLGGWDALNGKGRGNKEQLNQQKREDEFSSCRQSEIRQNDWGLFELVWSPTREL